MQTVPWKSRTTWKAKLHKPMRPKLVPISDGMAKRFGHGMMLIPTALQVDAMIRKIPRGQVSTLAQIRSRLARWHNADLTCPLVTGIFLRIVAEAAEEDRLGRQTRDHALLARGGRRRQAQPEVSRRHRGAGAAAGRRRPHGRKRQGRDGRCGRVGGVTSV